ncbi:MAG: AAA family ATPase [Chloroherpetonaceae bacterium]|nr:AAA family ATPase [Chloroherpetonaceae bacterium]
MKEWMIKSLKIENFKSIKSLEMKPKRINLLIGKPNVGKSNILEALSLFSIGKSAISDGMIRLKILRQLFYDLDTKKPISVSLGEKSDYEKISIKTDFSKKETLLLKYDSYHKTPYGSGPEDYTLGENPVQEVNFFINQTSISYDFAFKHQVKRYHYNEDVSQTSTLNSVLLHPHGENLISVLESNRELRQTVGKFFKPYGLKLSLNVHVEPPSITIVKELDEELFVPLPYLLIADTLKRIIFYLAAIKSNDFSTLLFEEPETHSYPPYIQQLALEIANSKNNQFFIATHSPYLFHSILEETPIEDVAVYLIDFQDAQTVTKALSNEEISEIQSLGTDIFFNLDKFLPSQNVVA